MNVGTHDRHAAAPGSGRIPLGIWDLGVLAGTFLFRWLIVGFPNDHFQHLSRARQILLGEVPIRDFFDSGFFLQNYLSSAAQLLFGYNLFGEALLTISFVALGTMLVFHLSARLSGSRWLAGAAALLTVLAYPRLYSYPKVFLYVAAIGLVWLYARRGDRLHVILMAALTALAFLLRHDHGVYIAIMMVCFLVLREWGAAQMWRRLGLYSVVTGSLLLPFLVFVQTTTGLVSYAVGSGPLAQTVAVTLPAFLGAPARFMVDRSVPLLVVDPPIGPINVRWGRRDRRCRTAGPGSSLWTHRRRASKRGESDLELRAHRSRVRERAGDRRRPLYRGHRGYRSRNFPGVARGLEQLAETPTVRVATPQCRPWGVHPAECAGLVLLPDAVGTSRRVGQSRRRLVVGTRDAARGGRRRGDRRHVRHHLAHPRSKWTCRTPGRRGRAYVRARSLARAPGAPARLDRCFVGDSNTWE